MENPPASRSSAKKPLDAKDLAEMAHQLRTPLTAIMGFADLLEVTDDQETILEYVRIIRTNAEKLNEMVKELLDPQP